jgi:hypothetical protein
MSVCMEEKLSCGSAITIVTGRFRGAGGSSSMLRLRYHHHRAS